MAERARWTDNEEKVVISKVGANPDNLQRAFREASVDINKSPESISFRWYRGGLRERCDKAFFTYDKKGTININRKIVSDKTSDNTRELTRSKWRRIISILFGNE